jgi:hypothetical protein
VSACSAEDRARLHTNVFGVLGPLVPPPDNDVERLFLTQVRPRGGDLGDGDSHGGVVGPFTGFPAEAPATDHGDLKFWPPWRAELVGGTEGITGCSAQHNADSPVKLSGCQFHEIESPFTH